MKNCSLNKLNQIFDGGNGTIQVIWLLKVKFYLSIIVITEFEISPQKRRKNKTMQPLVYNSFYSFFCFVLLYKSYSNPIVSLNIDIFHVIINIVFNDYILFN